MDRSQPARSIVMSAAGKSRWNETAQFHRTATERMLPAETLGFIVCEEERGRDQTRPNQGQSGTTEVVF